MITIIWLLTLTVCGAKGECVSQVIQDFEDQDKCLTIQQEYEDFPKDRNPRWTKVKYECKIKDGVQT